jgi:thioesterase domain-containing protein
LRSVQPHGPYYLGGYSTGGILVYEMARQLRAAGETVALLVLFDTRNPAVPQPRSSYRDTLLKAFPDPASQFTVDRWARFVARRIRGPAGSRLLAWNERRLLANRRQGNRAVKDDAVAIDDHIQTVYTRAEIAYHPKPFDGKLTLFRALTPEPPFALEPFSGWEGLVRGEIEVHDLHCGHLDMFSDAHAPAVARVLKECLQAAVKANLTVPGGN